jgi:uncharacterized membrane protein
MRARVVSGIAVLIPLFITFVVLRAVFGFAAGIVLPILDPAADHLSEPVRVALALGILFLIVYGLGELAAHVVGRRILSLGDWLLLRVPFVRVIYKTSRQVVSAFQRTDSSAFKSVVLVEFPHPGLRSVAFVTSTFSSPDGSEWKTVFIPTTPNPTTGFLQVVPASRVVNTDFTIEEAFQMVMSLGVMSPGRLSKLAPAALGSPGAPSPEPGDLPGP